MNFYNENDPKAAAWLRELIKAGEIPGGHVDERSITEIKPDDLDGFTQCHFFAGISGWSCALNLAGWPESRPVWTASLPCQPFSTAGQSQGVEDERHLWPVFFDLVKVLRPDVIFGEQVARAIGFNWLDGISADLEAADYAVGQAVLGAHSVGAPHKRQRLYWLGISDCGGRESRWTTSAPTGHWNSVEPTSCLGVTLGDAKCEGLEGLGGNGDGGDKSRRIVETQDGSTSEAGAISELADMQSAGRKNDLEPGQKEVFAGIDAHGSVSVVGNSKSDHERRNSMPRTHGQREPIRGSGRTSGPRESGLWSNYGLVFCRDDKFRRVEAGTFPLAHGFSESLACVLSRQRLVWKEIIEYAESHKTNASEVLRMVRNAIQQGESWKEQSTGMRFQFHAPALLLDLLLGSEAACDRASNESCGKKEGAQIIGRAMRVLRSDNGALRPSSGRESEEQRDIQSPDALYILPFILARHTEAYRQEIIDAHAALNRVAMLRGAGNAIVPALAAEFIQASAEVIDSLTTNPNEGGLR